MSESTSTQTRAQSKLMVQYVSATKAIVSFDLEARVMANHSNDVLRNDKR